MNCTHVFRAPVCMLCYCQRTITPADLSVHCPTVGFGKDISSRFSRELFRVYLENTSSAGKKPIRVRWYQTSKYWVSAFCSFSFHSGTVGVPLRWVFIIFLDHLGLKRVFFFLLMGMFGALIFLPMVLFKILWYGKYKRCRWCWQDVDAPPVRLIKKNCSND